MANTTGMNWPDPIEAVEDFYTAHMSLPLALFKDLQPNASGSGRPAGQRNLLWSATAMLAVAALEAGLEELVFSAHGVRSPSAPSTRNTRKDLVEGPLMTPSSAKIDRLLLAQFGIQLEVLAPPALYETRKKDKSNGGAAKGVAVTGPTTWIGLSEQLDALTHIRNATAHGDIVKLRNSPVSAEGALWVSLSRGGWSMQQPHALTALRVVVSVYNTVAAALDATLDGFDVLDVLRSPNDVVQYAS